MIPPMIALAVAFPVVGPLCVTAGSAAWLSTAPPDANPDVLEEARTALLVSTLLLVCELIVLGVATT